MTANRRTVGFNFLEEPELPAPQVTEAQAEDILATQFGMRASAKSLGSQQDRNFVVSGANGETLGVLKIANPAFNATELEAQDLAVELIATAEPSLRVALPLPNLAGEKCTGIAGLLSGMAFVRLLRFLPGGTLLESGYLSPAVVAGLGEVAARVSRALADFRHPGLDRILQWDLRYGHDVVAELISQLPIPRTGTGCRKPPARPGRGSAGSPITCRSKRSTSTLPTPMWWFRGPPTGPPARTGSSISAT